MSDNSPLIIKVEVHEEMYQDLFKLLEKVPARLRAEKLRSLANVANMIETGLINNIGEMVLNKLGTLNLSTPSIESNGNNKNIEPKLENKETEKTKEEYVVNGNGASADELGGFFT